MTIFGKVNTFDSSQCDLERRRRIPSRDPIRASDHCSCCDQYNLCKLLPKLTEFLGKVFLNYHSCSCQGAYHRLKQQAERTIDDNGVLSQL